MFKQRSAFTPFGGAGPVSWVIVYHTARTRPGFWLFLARRPALWLLPACKKLLFVRSIAIGWRRALWLRPGLLPFWPTPWRLLSCLLRTPLLIFRRPTSLWGLLSFCPPLPAQLELCLLYLLFREGFGHLSIIFGRSSAIVFLIFADLSAGDHTGSCSQRSAAGSIVLIVTDGGHFGSARRHGTTARTTAATR